MVRFTRPAAIVVTALIGAVVLVTTLPPWVHATTPTATGDLPVSAAGTTASPAAASVGLLIIAAALVLGLAGKVIRIGALLAVILTSIGAAAGVITFLAAPEVVAAGAAAQATSVRAVNVPVTVTVWPYVCLVVLILGAVVAAWLLTHLGTWKQVGRRYDVAGPPRAPKGSLATDRDTQARVQAMDDWDAISRGEDPS